VHHPQGLPLVFAGRRSGVQTLSGDHDGNLRSIASGASSLRAADHAGNDSELSQFIVMVDEALDLDEPDTPMDADRLIARHAD
jgi:hypothetical protein